MTRCGVKLGPFVADGQSLGVVLERLAVFYNPMIPQ